MVSGGLRMCRESFMADLLRATAVAQWGKSAQSVRAFLFYAVITKLLVIHTFFKVINLI